VRRTDNKAPRPESYTNDHRLRVLTPRGGGGCGSAFFPFSRPSRQRRHPLRHRRSGYC